MFTIILCIVLVVVGYRFIRFMHKAELQMEVLNSQVVQANGRVETVITAITGTVGDVAKVSKSVKTTLDIWSHLTIISAIYAIGRNVYTRISKKDEPKEKVEGKEMRSSDYMTVFDSIITILLIPMLLCKGENISWNVYGQIKRIGSAVRSVCNCFDLYQKLFSSSPLTGATQMQEANQVVGDLVAKVEAGLPPGYDSDNEEKGAVIRNDIPDTASSDVSDDDDEDEEKSESPLVKRRQAFIKIYLFKNPGKNEDASLWADHMTKVAMRNANPQNLCDAVTFDTLSVEEKSQVVNGSLKVARPVQKVKEDLVGILGEENRYYLNDIYIYCQKKPWLLPVALLSLFAVVIIIVRYMKKTTSNVLKEATVVVDATKGCCHNSSCPMGDKRPAINAYQHCGIRCGGNCSHWAECPNNATFDPITKILKPTIKESVPSGASVCYQTARDPETGQLISNGSPVLPICSVPFVEERKSTNASKQRSSTASKNKKRHYDASGGDTDSDEQGLFYFDELGTRRRRLGRRAKAHGTNFVINTTEAALVALKEVVADKMLTTELRKEFEKLLPVAQISEIVEGKRFPDPVKSKKKALNKVGECGVCHKLGHPTDQCWSKTLCTKCNVMGHPARACKTKKESQINGKESFTGYNLVHKSVGIATTLANWLNVTFIGNGFVVADHVFYDEKSKAWLTNLVVTVGDEKVQFERNDGKLIAEDMRYFNKGKAFKDVKPLQLANPICGKQVMIIAYANDNDYVEQKPSTDTGIVLSNDSDDMSKYTCTTANGMCSAPVVNTNGKVVGFHRIGSVGYNGFVPISQKLRESIINAKN